MKVLLREFGEDIYTWKDACYTSDGLSVDNAHIDETNIVSIMEDDRDKYFKCSVCGKIFSKANKKEWEAHTTKNDDYKKCFECRYMRSGGGANKKTEYELQEDQTFKRTVKEDEVILYCRRSYGYNNIVEKETHNNCIYNQCVNAEKANITNIFAENPEVFDTIITSDKILEVGYKIMKKYSEETRYTLKARNKIVAIANKYNIIDRFLVSYDYNDWTLYYSKKYNKLYCDGGISKYEEWNPRGLTQAQITYIFNKIAALYAGTEAAQ